MVAPSRGRGSKRLGAAEAESDDLVAPSRGRGSKRRMSSGLGPEIRSQSPMATRSSVELMVRNRTDELFYFNAIELGPKTPIAPGRGENWPFGERFGRSLRSRSPECTRQTPRKPGVFPAVSPSESGSLPGWWRPRWDSNARPRY